MYANKFHIIGITETWAGPHILDAELMIEGFTAIRSDRLDRKGGGTMLYVKDFLMPEEQTKLTNTGFQESAWCTVRINNLQLLVGVCYRSPTSDDANNNQLLGSLETASSIVNSSNNMRLMIMGDFNYPDIDYCNYAVSSHVSSAASNFFQKTRSISSSACSGTYTICGKTQAFSIGLRVY